MPTYADVRELLKVKYLSDLVEPTVVTNGEGNVVLRYDWINPVTPLPDAVQVPRWFVEHMTKHYVFAISHAKLNNHALVGTIPMIKTIREALGCGLKEAKDILELIIIPLTNDKSSR